MEFEEYSKTCDAVIDNGPDFGDERFDRCYQGAVGWSADGDGFFALSHPWPACREHEQANVTENG